MKSLTQIDYGALAIAGLCLLLGSVVNAEPTGKIEICHKAGERGQRILSINEEKDGEKHFGHGDYLVSAEKCDDIADNNCDGFPDNPDLDNYDCVIRTGEADAICDSGECMVPPPACHCAGFWASNGLSVNFPDDFTSSYGGLREWYTEGKLTRLILYYIGSAGNTQIGVQNFGESGTLCEVALYNDFWFPGPSDVIFVHPPDPETDISNCKDYITDVIQPPE